MGSTGAQDVLAIAALLQSTASDEQQLEDATDILCIKIPSTKKILQWNQHLDSVQWRPLEDRILRWLLSTLIKQEASPGNAIINPSTYFLLLILMNSCPEMVILRYLQHSDLSEILCKCLIYTRHELERLRNVAERKDNNKTLKRKRSSSRHDNVEVRREQCLANLTSICRLLECLYYRSRSDETASSHAWTIKNVLRIPVERAGIILEAALWCTLMAIDHSPSDSGFIAGSRLIRPFISVWDSARLITKSGDDLHSAVRRTIYTEFKLMTIACVCKTLSATMFSTPNQRT